MRKLTPYEAEEQRKRLQKLVDTLVFEHHINAERDLSAIMSGGETKGKDLIANLKQGKQRLRKSHVDNLVKKFPWINPDYLLHGKLLLKRQEPIPNPPDERELHKATNSGDSRQCIEAIAKYDELNKHFEWLKKCTDDAHEIAKTAQSLQQKFMDACPNFLNTTR